MTAQIYRVIFRPGRLEHALRASIHRYLEFQAPAFMVILNIQSQTPTKQYHTGETLGSQP